MKNVRLNTFASIVATIQPQLPPSGPGFWSEGIHVQPERDWAEPREALTVSGSPHDLQMVEILAVGEQVEDEDFHAAEASVTGRSRHARIDGPVQQPFGDPRVVDVRIPERNPLKCISGF